MYDERNDTYNKYSDYINTCDKYNYYIDDDINLYNLRTILDNACKSKSDYEYNNGILDLNKNIDSIFDAINNSMYSTKSKYPGDDMKKNRCAGEINKKKIELFTDFKQTQQVYDNYTLKDGEDDIIKKLKTDIEFRKSSAESLKSNRFYAYLMMLIVIILTAAFLFIYL